MGLRNAQYHAIMREYEKRQLKSHDIQTARYEEVYTKLPEFKSLDDSISILSVQYGKKLLNGDPTALSSLKEELALLRASKKKLLTSAGYPENYLEPVYECPDCKDTGYIGNEKCHCFKKAIIELLYEQSNIKKIPEDADFSNFSFHAVKNFTTAEGGAAVWKDIDGIDNEEIYHQYQLLSLHGQSKDALAKTQLGAWEYDIIGPWFKCNMTDVVAGIGLAQMKRYKGLLERRKEIIGKYDAAFKPIGIEVLNHYTENHQSSGHLYITRVPGITLEQRHEIIVKMAESGVACNVHYKPLPMMTAYKNMGFDIKDYPNAYKRFENEITLPLHTKLTDEEVDYIIENYCNVIHKVNN